MYVPAVSGTEAKTYQVEMLIFTNEDGSMANGGAPARPLIVAQEASELMERMDGANFQRLPDTELSLATAKSILEQSGAYEVIEHVAWRQPGLGEDAARAVRIRGGVDYQYTPMASPLLGQVYESDNSYTATPEPMTLPQLDGTVTVALNQYLHVHADFVLRTPVETPTIGIDQRLKRAPALYQYRIQQHRRMRSRQLHYFDHPLLGILVQITPVKPESFDQQSEPDQLEPTPAREQKPAGERPKIRGSR
jgi:Peptidoglycan-binding protein, CsiV